MNGVKRRITAVIACISALLVLYGCDSILDGYTSSVTAHQDPEITPTDSIIEVGTYDELKDAILGFVSEHEDTGLIDVYSYDGDIQHDVDNACQQIINNSPIGAYAVSEITGTARKIVSYYEVDISISYNVSKEQLDSIIPVATVRYLKSVLLDSLSDYEPSMTISTKNIVLTEEDALAYVEEIYYDNPMDIVMLPVKTIHSYPEYGVDRIMEFIFAYRNEPSTLKLYEIALNSAVQNIAESVSSNNDATILLSLCQHLMDTVTYDSATALSGEYSNQNISVTAYGALVTGSAVGEGYAMAYKALCDELGYECDVVLGTLDGIPHAWNIVALDDFYYHIDVSMCDVNGISTAFLMNDTAMAKTHTWDKTKYKVCDGPLTYASMTEITSANASAT